MDTTLAWLIQVDTVIMINRRNWPGLHKLSGQGGFHADTALSSNGEINLESTSCQSKADSILTEYCQ